MSNIISNRGGHRPAGYVVSDFFGENCEGSYMRELRRIDKAAKTSSRNAVIHVHKGESRLSAYLSTIPEKSKRKRRG